MLEHECSAGLPGVDPEWHGLIERLELAALRDSDFAIDRIRAAIDIAKTDWRDLLVMAGFADDLTAHLRWCDSAIAAKSVAKPRGT